MPILRFFRPGHPISNPFLNILTLLDLCGRRDEWADHEIASHPLYSMCPVMPFAISHGDGSVDYDTQALGFFHSSYAVEYNDTYADMLCKYIIIYHPLYISPPPKPPQNTPAPGQLCPCV